MGNKVGLVIGLALAAVGALILLRRRSVDQGIADPISLILGAAPSAIEKGGAVAQGALKTGGSLVTQAYRTGSQVALAPIVEPTKAIYNTGKSAVKEVISWF